MAVLDAMGLEYAFNTLIIEGRVYDFCLLDYPVLIEFDGEHWHHSKWAHEHGVPERDAYKNQLAKKAGYILIRIREREMAFPRTVENKIWRILHTVHPKLDRLGKNPLTASTG